MPRRQRSLSRKVQLDAIYGNQMVTKLINQSMVDGKKSVAQKQVYKAFEIIAEKTKSEPMDVFNLALTNIKPSMEVRPRRVGGAAYQIPMAVSGNRRDTLAIRWLVQGARGRSNSEFHSYAEKLAAEIVDASNQEGVACKKKADVEKMAEANRAFAHFKW